ncbi:MAG: SPFH domain-containing protein [Bernardetiaceae bacterium]|jgi:regulator of protease activity HflC (stomatin/prohibitin superfamily)|nr:SPFH domain-containing protein [Bernardetiaceae bacterium]
MEKTYRPASGYLMLVVELVVLPAIIIVGFILFPMGFPLWGALGLAWLIALNGFTIINPNEAMVFTLFGDYKGSTKTNGFFFVNPFFGKKKISLRARNLDSPAIKVNDLLGNPIEIGVILVWRVADTFKAVFDVDGYEHFVKIQSEAATRKLAGMYPYDDIEEHPTGGHTVTLRDGGAVVHDNLEAELKERLSIAGIEVIEARLNSLSYSPEIAQAMLQRQQATAVVAARKKIVEGAVGMVEMALAELSRKQVVELDDEKRAAMVSNLMVVLCSERSASPVVNAGTLHQ